MPSDVIILDSDSDSDESPQIKRKKTDKNYGVNRGAILSATCTVINLDNSRSTDVRYKKIKRTKKRKFRYFNFNVE